jgi:hypothetical protein
MALETQISAYLADHTIHPAFYELALDIINENKSKEVGKFQALTSNHVNLVNEIEKKLSRLFTFLVNGTIKEEEYSAQKKELENQLAIAKAKLSEAERTGPRWNELTENVLHFARIASQEFKNADTQLRKEIFYF